MNQEISKRARRSITALLAAAWVAMPGAALPLPARADVTRIMLKDPGIAGAADPAEALRMARERLLSHDAAAAIDGLERFLRIYPQEVDLRRFLGDLYFRNGDFTHAESTYRQILDDAPFDTETHRRLGMIDTIEHRVDAAIREFEASLPGSINDLVMSHRAKGDLDAFERKMQAQAESRAGDSDVQYEMAEVYDDIHLPYDAVTYFKRALVLYPKSTEALNGLAIAQMELHDYGGAEQTFAKCLADDAESYACRNDLGSLYIQEKHYSDAQIELDRARALQPEGPEALVNLGYMADERGDRQTGVRYYTQAIYIWPYGSDAYVDLAFDYVQQGSVDRADKVLLAGLAIAPEDARIHYLLGIVDEIRGKQTEALAEFTDAERSLDPEIVTSARENISDIRQHPSQARPQQSPGP